MHDDDLDALIEPRNRKKTIRDIITRFPWGTALGLMSATGLLIAATITANAGETAKTVVLCAVFLAVAADVRDEMRVEPDTYIYITRNTD